MPISFRRGARKGWVPVSLVVVDYLIRVVAIGTIPENRKPGSSLAWLMLVLFVPVIGLPLFLLLGSPNVTGRRNRIQTEVNKVITDQTSSHPTSEEYVREIAGAPSIVTLNRNLASFPLVSGRNVALHGDYDESIHRMAAAVDKAETAVHV